MKHLKKFSTLSHYNNYKNSDDFIMPNISICDEPSPIIYEHNRLIIKYNITSTSDPTPIFTTYAGDVFSAMIVDNVEETVDVEYTFDTLGIHTIEYTLTDPTTINDWTFYGCTNIISINIPNNVTTIGNGAFEGCTGITSVIIPNSVVNIGQQVFENCTSLTKYKISNKITEIPDYTFFGCIGLTNIVIPNQITSIGEMSFAGTSITSINIHNNITTIKNGAFSNCPYLTNIYIPSNVTSIGYSILMGSNNITSIIVDSNNQYFDSRNNCNAIIRTTANEILQGCNITTIPDDIVRIGSYAFAMCSFNSIDIPKKVNYVESYAFANCTNLTNIICRADFDPTLGYKAFDNISSTGTLYIKLHAFSDYSKWLNALGSNWTKDTI